MTVLRHPNLDYKWLAVHLANTRHLSALHNPSDRAQRSPWSERICCILIGMAAVLVPILMTVWAEM